MPKILHFPTFSHQQRLNYKRCEKIVNEANVAEINIYSLNPILSPSSLWFSYFWRLNKTSNYTLYKILENMHVSPAKLTTNNSSSPRTRHFPFQLGERQAHVERKMARVLILMSLFNVKCGFHFFDKSHTEPSQFNQGAAAPWRPVPRVPLLQKMPQHHSTAKG